MPVIYNGKALIPGPFVSISKIYTDSGTGLIGQKYQIKLIGKLVAYKGSPNSSGTFWTSSGYPPDETIAGSARLAALERKVEALKALFKTEGATLEWASENGATPLSCNPTLKGINFQEGQWVTTVDFSIDLEADQIYGLADPSDLDEFIVGDLTQTTAKHLESYGETWNIQENWDNLATYDSSSQTFIINHTITATGKRHYEPDGSQEKFAWEWAKDFCLARRLYDGSKVNQDVLPNSIFAQIGHGADPSGFGVFFTARTEDIDEAKGTCTLSCTYTLTNGKNYTGNISVGVSRGTQGASVSVSGEYAGLGDTLSERNDNAKAALSDATIVAIASANVNADSFSSDVVSLNPVPLNKTVTKNLTGGTISFSYEFNDRPTNLLTHNGKLALVEDYSLSYSGGTPMFAEIFCLGRAIGPVFQNLGTKTTKQKTLSINAVMNRSDSGTPPDVSPYLNIFDPILVDGAIQQYISGNTQSWSPRNGQFSYTITWNYE